MREIETQINTSKLVTEDGKSIGSVVNDNSAASNFNSLRPAKESKDNCRVWPG